MHRWLANGTGSMTEGVKARLEVPDKSDVLAQVLAQRERVGARLANIKRVVAVMSGKGGAGKKRALYLGRG